LLRIASLCPSVGFYLDLSAASGAPAPSISASPPFPNRRLGALLAIGFLGLGLCKRAASRARDMADR